jgi:hypothetical protein
LRRRRKSRGVYLRYLAEEDVAGLHDWPCRRASSASRGATPSGVAFTPAPLLHPRKQDPRDLSQAHRQRVVEGVASLEIAYSSAARTAMSICSTQVPAAISGTTPQTPACIARSRWHASGRETSRCSATVAVTETISLSTCFAPSTFCGGDARFVRAMRC